MTGGRRQLRTPGISSKCWCGESIIELISKTNQNPYRRYYRCLFAAQRKLHPFSFNYWRLVLLIGTFNFFEQNFVAWERQTRLQMDWWNSTDEIQQLHYQIRMLEEEFQFLKATIRSQGLKIMPTVMISRGCLILTVVVVLGILMYNNS